MGHWCRNARGVQKELCTEEIVYGKKCDNRPRGSARRAIMACLQALGLWGQGNGASGKTRGDDPLEYAEQ